VANGTAKDPYEEHIKTALFNFRIKKSELLNVHYRIVREAERIGNFARHRLRGLMHSIHTIPTDYSLIIAIEIYWPEYSGPPSSYREVLGAINERRKKDISDNIESNMGDGECPQLKSLENEQ